jgi:hypothetical protein
MPSRSKQANFERNDRLIIDKLRRERAAIAIPRADQPVLEEFFGANDQPVTGERR